jgi:hypothetical protein
MSYDFHYYRSDRFPYSQTRHNSPLFSRQPIETNNGLIVSLNAVIIVSYYSRLKNVAFCRPGPQVIGSIKECRQRRFFKNIIEK